VSPDGKSEKMIVPEYNKFATDNKGIFRIGSVECEAFEAICKKEGVTEFPTIKLYPPFPRPVQDFEIGDKFEQSKLKQIAGKFYTDRSIEITQNNHLTFVEEDVGTPKILLFTNAKKGTPFIYKALSQNFEVSVFMSFYTFYRKPYNLDWLETLKKLSLKSTKSRSFQHSLSSKMR
jgi:hypothetical protein